MKFKVYLINIFIVVIFWEVIAAAQNSPMLPGVIPVIRSLAQLLLTETYWLNIGESLYLVVAGFLAASLFGFITGLLIHRFTAVRYLLMPLIDAIRPVAALTIFPLLILLLGLGRPSKIAVIFWTAWPAILLSTIHGLNSVDSEIIEASSLDGASETAVLRHMKIPLALPQILTGLRIGVSGGWISLVAAEMLGSNRGLGYSVLSYSQTFRFPEMYATVIVISVLGYLMNAVVNAVQIRYERTYLTVPASD